ncbi:uncharacterized protein Dwil_GK28086 [Drosophila willistoni]|uniref:Uncharacterized protein n=1 Tax=Drosophila willistoni TaxID=7260 RepID=A0A0Q9X6F3_DROWI|nr:uncharacterized protein LOC124459838 [Drosophila willistoni]KRG00321.1 uncharacterized protein Dwil_GK28086 [Drosophila willistoni]
MATSVISSVVSTSVGRRNICAEFATPSLTQSKSKSVSNLGEPSTCACLRCQYLTNKVRRSQSTHCSSDDTLPVEHKHQPLSAISLGALSAKESPIFIRRQQLQLPVPASSSQSSCSSQFSLRSVNPQPELDLSAIEALITETEEIPKMPASSPRNNMDINRNNGYLQNGTLPETLYSHR